MRTHCLVVLGCLALVVGPAYAAPKPPRRTGHVIDQARVLTQEQRDLLESRLSTLALDSGYDCAVLTVDHLPPETIERFSRRVATAWHLGKRGVLLKRCGQRSTDAH